MASKMCCFSIVSYLLIFISNAAPRESFDYQDRTCDSHDCFYHAIKSFGECKLSQNKTSCDGTGCKFIGNSNIRLCVNPSILSSQTMDQLSKIVLSSSVSIGSQQLCLYDDNNNVHEELCKRAGQFAGGPDSYCHSSSKKCVMTHDQYLKIDSIFEDNIKKSPYKYGKISYELPYDYTNNILLVVDGTGTRKQFEESYKSPDDNVPKGGEYKMTKKARWSNGNWNSHSSNFYEDYRGAKYYWYGPDESLKTISAGSEVHALVEGVVDTVCTFIGNATMNGKYKMEDVNIDLIGYSRGGYAVMEAARKLDRDGCHGTKGINIRFMGLYDPVSTMTYCDSWKIWKCHSSVFAGDDKGLYYANDYKYSADTMPVNVKHIAISYGDPAVASRFVFNTAENEDDNKKRAEVDYIKFKTTHSGIGGCPLDGDYDSDLRERLSDIDLTVDLECSESMKADMFIRGKANQYKLPIDATDKDYYNLMIDGCEGHLDA